MNHSRIPQRVLLLLVVTTLVFSTVTTQAKHVTVLADLIDNGGSIVNGDKIFSDFNYSKTGEMPPATRVNVERVTHNGNFGLRFSGGFTDSPTNEGSDALITYKVTAPDRLISGAYLAANTVYGDGFISVTESFEGATDSLLLSVHETQTADSGDFEEPQMILMVEKNILAFATGRIWPTMSFVDQTFSQIPEPTTLVLGFVGIVALGLTSRRSRQA